MNRAPQGGWVQKLGQVGGAVLGFKYGHYVGAWVPYLPPGPDGMLEFLVGWILVMVGTVLIGNAIDARRQDSSPAGTSTIGLILRGLGWRAFARFIWAAFFLAPVAAAILIYRILAPWAMEVLR
jgi:hypothetical protein